MFSPNIVLPLVPPCEMDYGRYIRNEILRKILVSLDVRGTRTEGIVGKSYLELLQAITEPGSKTETVPDNNQKKEEE